MDQPNEEKKENASIKSPVRNVENNNINKKLFRSTNLSKSSKYKSNSSANFTQINKSQKIIINKYTTTSTSTNNNQNINNSNLIQKDEIKNKSKKYENKDIKFSLINTTSRKFISSNRNDINKANKIKKGNINNKENCSVFISSSSNLKPDNKNNFKIKNKSFHYNNNNTNSQGELKMNNQNKGFKSKTLLINPDEYLKKDLEKDFKTKYSSNLTDNKFVYSNRPTNTSINNIKDDKNNEINNSNPSSSPLKLVQKIEYKPKYNFMRRTFFDSDITNKINQDNKDNKDNINKDDNKDDNDNDNDKKENNENNNDNNNDNNENTNNDNNEKTKLTDYYKQPLISISNMTNITKTDEKPKVVVKQNLVKPAISIVKKNIIKPKISVYTSNNVETIEKKTNVITTDTKIEEKNINNKNNNNIIKIITKYSNTNTQRNKTPIITSSSSIKSDKKYRNQIHYISSLKKIQPKKPFKITYRNTIPYNDKYKKSTDNILNKTGDNYPPRNSVENKNINSNIKENLNKNRYNFPITPRMRDYSTKTEIYKSNNDNIINNIDNEKKEKEYKNTIDKYKNEFKEILQKNRYETKPINNRTPDFVSKYGVKTSIGDRTNLKFKEYEVTDIKEYKKKQNQRENNLSMDKFIPKRNDYITKEYTTFERSFININDNKKAITKEQITNIRITGGNSKNNAIFISNNTSKNNNKNKYKTSTEIDTFRDRFKLRSVNEYEVQMPKFPKYNKIIGKKYDYSDKHKKNTDKYKNLGINKNNYFYAMNNFEEENEIDDHKEKADNLPKTPLTKLRTVQSQPKEKKYFYSLNISTILDNLDNNNITNANTKEDKNNEFKEDKYIKDIKENTNIKIINDVSGKIDKKKPYITNLQQYNNNITKNIKNFSYLEKYKKEKEKEEKEERERKEKEEKEERERKEKEEKEEKEKETEKEEEKKEKEETENIIYKPINIDEILNKIRASIEQVVPKEKPEQVKLESPVIPQKPIEIQMENDNKQTYQEQQQSIESTIKSEKKEKLNLEQQNLISNLLPQNQITNQKLETVHQEIKFIGDGPQIIEEEEEENNTIKKLKNKNREKKRKEKKDIKFTSYFGDSNNTFYEIKRSDGVTISADSNISSEEEEEEEEDDDEEEEDENVIKNENENENEKEKENVNEIDIEKLQRASKHSTYKIKTRKKKIPSEIDDKEEKEADEQILEEDELSDVYYENMDNDNEEGVGEENEKDEIGEKNQDI